MNKIGLKLWNINTDYYLHEAKKLYEGNLFDYIELYIVPNNLDKLEKWKTLNIPFDIHAPHFEHRMNLSSYECFHNNIQLYKEVKLYADELKSKSIIFHGGTDGDYKETAEQLNNINDKRTLIENKPYKTMPYIDGDKYVGSTYEEIKYIMDKTGCGFCLDIGHAICSANSHKIEPYQYIKNFLTLEPQKIHLSDVENIDTEIDSHCHYGTGGVNFDSILKLIPKEVPITIETSKDSIFNLDCFVNDVSFLKDKISINT